MINEIVIGSKWMFVNVVKHPIAIVLRMLCYIVAVFFVSNTMLALIIAIAGIVDSFVAADWEVY